MTDLVELLKLATREFPPGHNEETGNPRAHGLHLADENYPPSTVLVFALWVDGMARRFGIEARDLTMPARELLDDMVKMGALCKPPATPETYRHHGVPKASPASARCTDDRCERNGGTHPHPTPLRATHRCTSCGRFWTDNKDGTWSLAESYRDACPPCCDGSNDHMAPVYRQVTTMTLPEKWMPPEGAVAAVVSTGSPPRAGEKSPIEFPRKEVDPVTVATFYRPAAVVQTAHGVATTIRGTPIGEHTKIDPDTGQQVDYLVLSVEERAKGFVRPVRFKYIHDTAAGGCGALTTMGEALSETYARTPTFYGSTFCARCRNHYPVGKDGQFTWDGTDQKVGT